jgi:hypothetical protein
VPVDVQSLIGNHQIRQLSLNITEQIKTNTNKKETLVES